MLQGPTVGGAVRLRVRLGWVHEVRWKSIVRVGERTWKASFTAVAKLTYHSGGQALKI